MKTLILKLIILIGGVSISTSLTSCEQKPEISACQCKDNYDSGAFDLLSEKEQKVRRFCMDKYAGWAGMYLECKKEKGETTAD